MTVTTVTRENFGALLPVVLHHIREADFVAFDTELTGLCASAENRYSYYDSPEERYAKLRASALSFGALQYGLAAFKWSPSARRYEATCWSFHVFPASAGSSAGEHACWALQLSTVHFLAEHGFDFNRSLREGVPCASARDEAVARESRASRAAALDEERMVPLSPRDAEFVEEMAALIEAHGRDVPLVLPGCSAFRRLLLHQRLPARFPGLSLVRDGGRDAGSLVASFPTPEEAAALDAAFEAGLAEAAGFRRVFDQVARHGRPLVGHNCWLDALHAASDVLGDVPETLAGFAAALEDRLLPGASCLFDTKNLARAVFRALDGFVPLEESICRVCLPPGVADAPARNDDAGSAGEAGSAAETGSAGNGEAGSADAAGTAPAPSSGRSAGANARSAYATSAYGGATPSELTLAAGNTSLETLATLADDVQRWGVRVPVSGGRTPTSKRGRGGKTVSERSPSFHDAGFDAYCTGKVFVALAALLARRARADSSPEDVRSVVEALVRPSGECAIPIPPSVLQCRDAVFMMTSDYEDGVAIRGGPDALAAQRHPDRSNVVVAESPAGPLRTPAVLSALRAAIGPRTYVADGRSHVWPHAARPSLSNARPPPDATVSFHASRRPTAFALLPFALESFPGASCDGSVVVSVERSSDVSVDVRLWPYSRYVSRAS